MLLPAISVSLLMATYLRQTVFQSPLARFRVNERRIPPRPGLVGDRSGPRWNVVVAARDEEAVSCGWCRRVCRLEHYPPNCLKSGGWSMNASENRTAGLWLILKASKTPQLTVDPRQPRGGRRQIKGRSNTVPNRLQGRWMLVPRWPMPGLQGDLAFSGWWPMPKPARWSAVSVAQGGG